MFAYYKVPAPEPEPDPPLDDPEPGYIEVRVALHTANRHRSTRPCPDCRLAFQRWRARGGAFADDTVAVPLTDDEIDYLAKYVLP